jgi:hypothetical protein
MVCIFLVIASCDMVFDIDVPFEKKLLVVNSYINPDSVLSVSVSLNKHILDTLDHQPVVNAAVVIYENDIAIDQLVHRGSGRYTSNNNVKPSAGKTYKIEVSADKYDAVSAYSHIPNPAPLTMTEVDEISDEGRTKITLRFQDNSNETNYYQIKAYNREPHLEPGFVVRNFDYPVSLNIDDPTAEEQNIGDWGDGVFLKDLLFNGKEKEVVLKAGIWGSGILTIEVRTISADLYDYEVTSSLQQNINDDPLAQPINVYSNIKNGFGIFAGYSSAVHTIGEAVPGLVIISSSASQVSPGDIVELVVENLRDNEYIMIAMKAGSYYYTWAHATRTSENTIEFIVPGEAESGKIAVVQRNTLGVSDFEIIVQ